jgi:hypothetical protein
VPLHAADDSTISSGTTSISTQRDFVPGFPVEHQTTLEIPVKNTIGSKGQPIIIIDSSFPDPISETASTIPMEKTSLLS